MMQLVNAIGALRFGRVTATVPRSVVILGNGIGGVNTATRLNTLLRRTPEKATVTLVGKDDQYVFNPYLPDILTKPKKIYTMASLFPASLPVQFKKATVSAIVTDPQNKHLETDQGDIPFDDLVVSVGSQTAFWNTSGAEKNSLQVQSLADIDRIQASVNDKLTRAAHEPDRERKKQLSSFVLVGGGATGVEMAFHLDAYIQDFLKNQTDTAFQTVKPKLVIVESGETVIKDFSEKEQDYVTKRLKDRSDHIELYTGHKVDAVDPSGFVLLRDKKANTTRKLETIQPIWVTGVRANALVESLPFAKSKGNQRVYTNPFLEVPGRPDIYCIGDAAAAPASPKDFETPETERKLLPPTGQVATQQARYVADRIGNTLGLKLQKSAENPFEYHHKGSMLSLGPGDGTFKVGSIFLTGGIANFLRERLYQLRMPKHYDTREDVVQSGWRDAFL